MTVMETMATRLRPTGVVRWCRWTWLRLGVPLPDVAEMTAELQGDLALAEADGRSPMDYVGGDPAGFARAWAAARGSVPQRLYLFRLSFATVLGAVPGFLSGLFLLFGLESRSLAQVVTPDPQYCVPGCIPEERLIQLPTDVRFSLAAVCALAAWAGALAAASAILRFHGDAARRSMILLLAPVLPIAALAGTVVSHEYGRARDYAYGWSMVLPEIAFPFAAVALATAVLRFAVVVYRRKD